MTSLVPQGKQPVTPSANRSGALQRRWWQNVDEHLSRSYRPILRVVGVVSGAAAFAAAGMAVVTSFASDLLVASGGFGALAFGAAGVLTQLAQRDGALRKARALSRLARRSIVEMINGADGVIMAHWIRNIGYAKSLDPVLKQLTELLDLMAPVGGWRAEAAEHALYAFIRATNHINPLFAKIPKIGDFDKESLSRKGKILGALIAANEALTVLAPMDPDEPKILSKLLDHAEALERWYGESAT